VIKPDFICTDKLLSRYSTLGIGGEADFFAKIESQARLLEALEFAKSEDLDTFIIGRGSNILFSDEGFRGLVLKIYMKRMHHFVPQDELSVEAGALVSAVVDLGMETGFTGFENFAGLPGTVGGAIYGNAGCFGSEFWERVRAAKFFDGKDFGEINLSEQPAPHSYRSSIFKEHPNWTIISASLKIEEADSKLVAKKVGEVVYQRSKKQPQVKSVGCIFENPVRDGKRVSAGKLIDETGLKGARIGNAEISPVHANFFVNLGGATANDFIELIKLARGRVFEKFKIVLKEEIIRVGVF